MQLKRIVRQVLAISLCVAVTLGFGPVDTMADESLLGDDPGYIFNESTGEFKVTKNGVMCPDNLREKVKSAVFTDDVTSIEQQIFCFCNSLTSVTISDSVTSIGECAFASCHSLTSVKFGKKVTIMGMAVFGECPNLTIMIIPGTTVSFDFGSIFDGGDTNKLVIYGIPGSPTQTSAEKYGISFKDIKDLPPTPDPEPSPSPTPTPTPTPDPKPSTDPKSTDPAKRFSDVPAGKWYSKPDGPIAYVIANGIMKGTGDGSTFNPDGDCTREMFVQILYNAEGAPGAGPSDTTFGVGGNVTREQLVQFLMNYATTKKYDTSATTDLSVFPDSGEISGWASNAVSWANANGIINGKSKDGVKVLDPKGNATRAEVAQMVMSFQKKFGK